MKVVGDRSVARGLQRALSIVNVALFVMGVVLAVTTLFVWFAPGFGHSAGSALRDGGNLGGHYHLTDTQVVMKERIFMTGTAVSLGLAWLINDRLRKLLGAVNIGHAFQLANVSYLRTIGFALLGGQVVSLLQRLSTVQLVGAGTAEPGGVIDLKMLVAIAVIFVIAEVFRQGTHLQDDAAMTV